MYQEMMETICRRLRIPVVMLERQGLPVKAPKAPAGPLHAPTKSPEFGQSMYNSNSNDNHVRHLDWTYTSSKINITRSHHRVSKPARNLANRKPSSSTINAHLKENRTKSLLLSESDDVEPTSTSHPSQCPLIEAISHQTLERRLAIAAEEGEEDSISDSDTQDIFSILDDIAKEIDPEDLDKTETKTWEKFCKWLGTGGDRCAIPRREITDADTDDDMDA